MHLQVKIPPVQHVRHESVDEIETPPVQTKRKISPNRDLPGPSNSVEYGPETKRQKVNNVRNPLFFSLFYFMLIFFYKYK